MYINNTQGDNRLAGFCLKARLQQEGPWFDLGAFVCSLSSAPEASLLNVVVQS